MVNERRLRDTLATMRKDELSGLLTQTALLTLARELDKLAGAKPFAVVLVHVVQFQMFKDNFGQSGAARALAHAGSLIAKAVRTTDMAGRYGEHAFCIVLPGYDESEAALFTTRLMAAAAQKKVALRDGREVPLTLTAASACRSMAPGADGRLETVHDVIDRAEDASCFTAQHDWPQGSPMRLPRLESIAVV
jgi:diguanylate cyclase (GGDEF)-like protein